ncbi:MAG: UPF0182 family protein, partial [Brasilonema sp.]
MSSGLLKRSYRLIFLLLGLWLFFDLTCHLGAEIFWFNEVGYLREFLLRLLTQLGVWAVVFLTSVGFLLGNFLIAARLKYPLGGQGDETIQNGLRPAALTKWTAPRCANKVQNLKIPTPHLRTQNSGLELRSLLPIVIALSALAGFVLIY